MRHVPAVRAPAQDLPHRTGKADARAQTLREPQTAQGKARGLKSLSLQSFAHQFALSPCCLGLLSFSAHRGFLEMAPKPHLAKDSLAL